MRFSVGSWSFHALHAAGAMTLFGYLESMRYRYHAAEADIWSGMFASTDPSYVETVRQGLFDCSLSIANLAVDGADLWHADPEVRAAQRARALTYLEIARSLSAKTVRIDMGVMDSHLTPEQFEMIVSGYKEYAAIAARSGFRVGPQTHQPGTLHADNLVAIQRAVDSDAFGVVLDVNRWTDSQDTGDEKVAPFVMHTHFDRAFVDLVGTQVQEKIRLLRSAGYDGCWSLEYRGGAHEYEEVAFDLAALRRAVRLVLG